MGLDPEDDTYEEGDECTLCVDDIFGGVTPKTVLAVIQDVNVCPLSPPPIVAPNGTFTLTQGPECRWTGRTSDGYFIAWALLDGLSSFSVEIPHVVLFSSVIHESCIDSFDNQTGCGSPLDFCFGGSAQIFWGPDIPPPC